MYKSTHLQYHENIPFPDEYADIATMVKSYIPLALSEDSESVSQRRTHLDDLVCI